MKLRWTVFIVGAVIMSIALFGATALASQSEVPADKPDQIPVAEVPVTEGPVTEGPVTEAPMTGETVGGDQVAAPPLTYTLIGLVQDPDGNPLKGVRVYLDALDDYVLTNSDGSFTMANVAEGTHELYYPSSLDSRAKLGTFNTTPSETNEIAVSFSIDPANGLMVHEAGRVFDTRDNSGLGDVEMRYLSIATGKTYISLTADDGSYAIDLPYGEYQVSLTKPGFKTTTSSIAVGRHANKVAGKGKGRP